MTSLSFLADGGIPVAPSSVDTYRRETDFLTRLEKLVRGVLSPVPISRSAALGTSERLSAATHLVNSLEYLVNERDRAWGGVNNWDVGRAVLTNQPESVRRFFDLIGDRRITRALLLARVGAAAALLGPLPRGGRVAANALLSASSVALYPRSTFGTDGSDQVSILVQAISTIARAGERRPEIVDACLWFLALQSTLSYAVSGWVKLAGRSWVNGEALPGIMRTYNYGDRGTWELLRKYPRVGHVLGGGTLAFECLFPAVLFTRGRLTPAMAATAATFHAINARVMGLGRFLSAFTSMHPALLYVTAPRERAALGSQTRNDLMPKIATALGGATLVGGLTAQARRRAVVNRGREDEHILRTSSGNALCYRGTVPAEGTEPVVIFENGLSSGKEYWSWIEGELSQQFPTITYDRAGYGRSRYAGGAEYQLDTAVHDLVDLVKHVVGDRRVILIGHSLGGYLALRGAAELPAHVAGVGLLDTSHPAQLRRSKAQAQGADMLSDLIRTYPESLRFGLGWLLQAPLWKDQLPRTVRRLVLAHYRDPRMWAATRREWRAARREWDHGDGPLPRVEVPLCVVTAEKTAKKHAEQRELHDEVASAAPRADRHIIPNADHMDLLTVPNHALRVADMLVEFINGLSMGKEIADAS